LIADIILARTIGVTLSAMVSHWQNAHINVVGISQLPTADMQ
jgi:hypothetical protein